MIDGWELGTATETVAKFKGRADKLAFTLSQDRLVRNIGSNAGVTPQQAGFRTLPFRTRDSSRPGDRLHPPYWATQIGRGGYGLGTKIGPAKIKKGRRKCTLTIRPKPFDGNLLRSLSTHHSPQPPASHTTSRGYGMTALKDAGPDLSCLELLSRLVDFQPGFSFSLCATSWVA